MNSIVTRKGLSEQRPLWNRKWWYSFRLIDHIFEEAAVSRQIVSLEKRYAALCLSWTKDKNSEWISRHYLAGKMILSATIQINAMQFAEAKNLRVVGPYLRYYTIFSLMRAIVFTLPEQQWKNGSLSTLSHKKILAVVIDYLRYFDPKWSQSIVNAVTHLRHERELISYWHPSSGDATLTAPKDIVRMATALAELAQFNSEILERAIMKKADRSNFVFLDEYAESLSQVELVGHMHVDWDDAYRLDYIARKHPVPANISHTITEGHVDDVMIGWCAEEPGDNKFDPDEEKSVIFDLP